MESVSRRFRIGRLWRRLRRASKSTGRFPTAFRIEISLSIMKRLVLAFGVIVCVLLAQEKTDEATTAKIRSEEMEHSQIMRIEHMLADRYGPRVTGTPNHEEAAKWAVTEMTKWGMKNGHLEAWDYGRAGWLNDRAYGFITAPVKE